MAIYPPRPDSQIVPTVLTEPYKDPEGTFRADSIGQMLYVVPGWANPENMPLVKYWPHVINDGVPRAIFTFDIGVAPDFPTTTLLSFQNRTNIAKGGGTKLRITINPPRYIQSRIFDSDRYDAETRSSTGTGFNPYTFDLPPVGDVESTSILPTEKWWDPTRDRTPTETRPGSTPDENGLLLVEMFFSELQANQILPTEGVPKEGKIFLVVEPLDLNGPVYIDPDIGIPKDWNAPEEEEPPEDEHDTGEDDDDGVITVEVPIFIDRPVDREIPIQSWVTGVPYKEFEPGDLISTEPVPAGWVARADGRMYPGPTALGDPRIPYGGIRIPELEQLLDLAKNISPKLGSKRRGFKLAVDSFAGGPDKQDAIDKTIPYFIADIGPEPKDFQVIKWWHEFEDGTSTRASDDGGGFFGTFGGIFGLVLATQEMNGLEATVRFFRFLKAQELSEEAKDQRDKLFDAIAAFSGPIALLESVVRISTQQYKTFLNEALEDSGITNFNFIDIMISTAHAWKITDEGGRIYFTDDDDGGLFLNKVIALMAVTTLFDIEEHGEGELHDRILEPR